MPPKPLEPGDPLRLGRFELLGRLGEGGQGIVYLGRGTNPGEDRVAVKVLAVDRRRHGPRAADPTAKGLYRVRLGAR